MDSALYQLAVDAFTRLNEADPNPIEYQGAVYPRDLIHARLMEKWVMRLNPEASEAVRLAAHAQHLRRWEIPRDSYPEGRTGYLQWRTRLYEWHAQVAGEVLRELAYEEDLIQKVQTIIRKQGLRTDPDVQLIEDALCLTFLELQLDDMIQRTEPDKLRGIIRKTWKKMSPAAHQAALRLDLPPEVTAALVDGAPESQP